LLKLSHVLVDGIIEADLALPNGEGQQRCVKNFAKRSEVEQRIRSEWTCRRLIGYASVKKQRATANPNGDGYSAGFLRSPDRPMRRRAT
jgi:hypothetical protein